MLLSKWLVSIDPLPKKKIRTSLRTRLMTIITTTWTSSFERIWVFSSKRWNQRKRVQKWVYLTMLLCLQPIRRRQHSWNILRITVMFSSKYKTIRVCSKNSPLSIEFQQCSLFYHTHISSYLAMLFSLYQSKESYSMLMDQCLQTSHSSQHYLLLYTHYLQYLYYSYYKYSFLQYDHIVVSQLLLFLIILLITCTPICMTKEIKTRKRS